MQKPQASHSKWNDAADGELAQAITREPGRCPDAEAEFYQRFARRVRLYGLRHLGGEDPARDLTHNVMVLTLEKLRRGEVREPERVGSFVLGVARMLVHEHYRSRSREELLGNDPPPDHVLEPVEPDRLASARLKKCMELLSERERAILVLTYYGEQSTKTIASSLGLGTGNVRVIRHRGIAQLRDCIGVGEEPGR
jgi:RNA polymerase sigma-70 factor (ECF subfamily)